MTIIAKTGRRHPKTLFLYAVIYVALILGAITMVYPFLLMLSGSTKSPVDLREFNIIPRFLYDDAMLYRKHMEGLFNESLDALNVAYDADYRSFDSVDVPRVTNPALIQAWQQFLREEKLPVFAYACGYLQARVSKTIPISLRRFKRYLSVEISPRISEVNTALGTDFNGWNAFFVIPEDYLPRRSMPIASPFMDTFWKFKRKQPEGLTYCFSLEGFYKKLFLRTQYSRDIKAYNEKHGTSYGSYDEVRLTRRVPKGTEQEISDWEQFVRTTLNLLWIRVDASAQPIYQDFLRAKYGTINVLNRNYDTSYKSFREIQLPGEPELEGIRLSDWNSVISGWKDPETGILHEIPIESISISGLDFAFRDYLQQRFGDIAAVNHALNTDYASFNDTRIPQQESHYSEFHTMRGFLRREFISRNYLTVIDYMMFHGRGILNTFIYCTLAVLAALIVNPLAAYAMSRYRMPGTYRILLFLMATMAFPAMVTQIPVFLMLRNFNLLNTFGALVLPGLANGYSIFLLKGFFDSLPRELYESAQLDGANEWTMFWRITMSLSKPILAVIALQAFTLAYSNFMFALLLCQDEKMWTLMVWLYQLQQRSGQAVVYASLIIAAIPTFVIFVFCQKIIMRGIVVPVEQ